jgi:Peptidase family M48
MGADGHHVVRVAALLGAAGLLAAAAAMGAAIGSLHHVSVAARHLEVVGLRFSFPSFNAAEWIILAVAVLGAAAAIVAVRAAWRQRLAYRGFLDQLEVVRRFDGHPSVLVIADPRPQAFCAGYLRPTVYISQRAVDLLSGPELRAVLAHEHHHRQVRDPLRFACGRILGQALFFVPVLRSLCDRYADLAELSADSAAIRACAGDRAALASALLVFDASAPPGVSGISPERVDSLLGHAPRWRPSWWLLAASLGSLSSLLLLIWRAGEVASASATFSLPFLSSQPCLVMSLLLPVLACVAIVRRRGGAGRD